MSVFNTFSNCSNCAEVKLRWRNSKLRRLSEPSESFHSCGFWLENKLRRAANCAEVKISTNFLIYKGFLNCAPAPPIGGYAMVQLPACAPFYGRANRDHEAFYMAHVFRAMRIMGL